MSLQNAQLFVEEMKENREFRALVSEIDSTRSLNELLKEKEYLFDQKDLVRAMAACMAEMDGMMGG